MQPKEILYLTQDGLLEPLMFSQVVRVIERLAATGRRYRLLSLEKPRDLRDSARVTALQRRLSSAGVSWEYGAFDWSQSTTAAAKNVGFLTRRAVELARKEMLSAIHARSYVAGVAALAAWNATGLPWIFDARGYWIDERLEEGRWFTTPFRLGVARGLEHQLFTTSTAVVTLTELQARDVERRFPSRQRRVVRCITTVADFADFRRRPVRELSRVPAQFVGALHDKRVVAVIGSINRSYLVDETLDLARRILERDARAHLLVLSGQADEYARRLDALGVPKDRVTLTRAEHDAMPEWLSLVEWCLLLLQPKSVAKQASMPTKLGELFASGVRPVQFGCNAEVGEWVRRAGSGVVLDEVGPAALDAAAAYVANSQLDGAALELARQRTEAHFSLDAGTRKYSELLDSVLGPLG